jgi:hypothetical protein
MCLSNSVGMKTRGRKRFRESHHTFKILFAHAHATRNSILCIHTQRINKDVYHTASCRMYHCMRFCRCHVQMSCGLRSVPNKYAATHLFWIGIHWTHMYSSGCVRYFVPQIVLQWMTYAITTCLTTCVYYMLAGIYAFVRNHAL